MISPSFAVFSALLSATTFLSIASAQEATSNHQACLDEVIVKWEAMNTDAASVLVECALFTQNPNRFIYGMYRNSSQPYSLLEMGQGLKYLRLCDEIVKKIQNDIQKCDTSK